MLLPAAQNLSSPCLSEGWNEAYEAWAYMFVTVAIVFMQVRRVAGVPAGSLTGGHSCFQQSIGVACCCLAALPCPPSPLCPTAHHTLPCLPSPALARAAH